MTETSKGDGLFGKMAGLFVQKTEDDSENPAPPTPKIPWGGQKTATKPTAPLFVPDNSVEEAAAATVDPAIQKILEKDLNEAAKPAYSQFVATEQSLQAVMTDEGQRFKAALAVIGGQGHTLDKVLFDIDECLDSLVKKEKENAVGAAKAREEKVGKKQAELVAGLKEISSLENQLNARKLHVQDLQGQIETEEAKIQEVAERFTATVAAVRQELTERRNHIEALAK